MANKRTKTEAQVWVGDDGSMFVGLPVDMVPAHYETCADPEDQFSCTADEAKALGRRLVWVEVREQFSREWMPERAMEDDGEDGEDGEVSDSE